MSFSRCASVRNPGSMFSRRRFLLTAALLLAAVPCASFAAEPKPATTLRLLTIGNSFSANATHYLGDLAAANGNKLIHHSIVVGGAPLQLHAEKAQRFERDPEAKEGRYANGRSLKDEL